MHEGIPMAMPNHASNLITTAFELLDTLSTTPVESISNLHFVIQFERWTCQFFTHCLSISYPYRRSIGAGMASRCRLWTHVRCRTGQRHAEYGHRGKGHRPTDFAPVPSIQNDCGLTRYAERRTHATDAAAQGDATMQCTPRYAWWCHAPAPVELLDEATTGGCVTPA
jgi:hypothetical protein